MIDDLLERSGSLPTDLRNEQAWRAVKAFRKLQPTLSSYARILTGNKHVTVECAAQDNGSTDGKRIFLRPPIALGDNTPHEPMLCNTRNEDGLQRCIACSLREAVLITIYHEIAHIAFDSFARTSDQAKRTAVEMAAKQSGAAWAKVVEDRIRKAPKWKTADYLNLASLVSPFLPIMVNSLEDARVNKELFKVREGLKRMFEADEIRIFEKGYEVVDPATGKTRTQFWNQAPLNSQVTIGVFCKAVGYNYDNWFHKKVVEALDDEELTVMLKEMDDIKSIGQVYNLSFRVIARLRDLGFFETPEDPNPEPEAGDSNEEGEGEGESSEDESDSTSGSGESGEDDESNDSMGSSPSDGDTKPEGSDDRMEGDSSESSDSSVQDGEEDDGPSGDPSNGDAGSGEHGESSVPDLPEESSGVGNESGAQHDSDGTEQGESSGEAPHESMDDDTPVDTGADDGYGGTRVIGDDEDFNESHPPMGTPEEVVPMLQEWNGHAEKPKTAAIKQGEEAVDVAIVQGIYFTMPSKRVNGVEERYEGDKDAEGWTQKSRLRTGSKADILVPESILQPSILHTRRAFTDNKRGARKPNLKSGKVNTRVLGKRAWSGDERLFQKTTQPGKKSYYVQIMMDISYSTVGRNLALEKRAVFGQAEMLSRVGVPFEVLGHTGDYASRSNGLALQIYHIKDSNEPWNDKTIRRLESIGPVAANLDGHCLEFARKRVERSTATDRIILYYSDGKMPAENHDEELEILQREIKYCTKNGILLLGVGIRTDSPSRHGMDTVQVDTDEDLSKVVKHLSSRLSAESTR